MQNHSPMFPHPFDPQSELVAVIMAGGAGTRFWPASTRARPKQFLTLLGERSLLQQSYDRLAAFLPAERILVLTSQDFVPLVGEQLPELPAANVVGEPLRRDTAAAVALAAALCRKRFGDPVMAVLTADHLIETPEDFWETLVSAARAAAAGGSLLTMGIEPAHPATGYGYLELGDELGRDGAIVHHQLSRFVEKPDAPTALGYLQSGRHLWNSGMFLWRTSTIEAEYERQLPAHLEAMRVAVLADGRPDFGQSLSRAFEPLAKVSVDYGIMERAESLRCVRASFSWSDVGGFASLADHLPTDEDGNAHRGQLFALESRGNVVFAEDDQEVIALVGAEDLVVVRAGRCTLVARLDRAEDVKKLVGQLDEGAR